MTKINRRRKKLKQNAGELAIAEQLKAAQAVYSFEPHSFKYEVPATYTPDFSVTKKDGSKMYLEIKGHHRGLGQWFSKIKHFIKQNPNIDFRIIFLDASKKINKNYKSNLGEAASRIGIKWADKGQIPKEWLDE